jgi:hypothetical protein
VELASEGDHAGAAIWRRITIAIEQLMDTTGPLNGTVRLATSAGPWQAVA